MTRTRADRVQRLLSARGVGRRQQRRAIADVCDLSYEAVRLWFIGDTSTINADHLALIARKWKANLDWLLEGKGPMDAPTDSVAAHDVRRIPVLDYVQAGDLKKAFDDYASGAVMNEVIVEADLARELSAESFAMVIKCVSMEPDFNNGDLVIVDPGVQPLPGDFIIAKMAADNEAVFRKYRSRGMDASGYSLFELVPLNEDYHTVMATPMTPGQVVGVMIEHRRRRRM